MILQVVEAMKKAGYHFDYRILNPGWVSSSFVGLSEWELGPEVGYLTVSNRHDIMSRSVSTSISLHVHLHVPISIYQFEMYIYIYIYIHTYMHACMHTCIHTYMHA